MGQLIEYQQLLPLVKGRIAMNIQEVSDSDLVDLLRSDLGGNYLTDDELEILSWFNERWLPGDGQCYASILHHDYRHWCRLNRRTPQSRNMVGKALRNLQLDFKRMTKGYVYHVVKKR